MAPKNGGITHEEWQLIDAGLECVRSDIQIEGRRNPTVDANALVKRLPSLGLRLRVMRWCLREGRLELIRHLDARHASSVPDPRTKKNVAFQARIGVQAIDGDGRQLGFWEREDWWRVSIPDFLRWALEQEEAAERQAQRVRQIAAIKTVIAKGLRTNPDAETVEDAFAAAAVDPRDWKVQ